MICYLVHFVVLLLWFVSWDADWLIRGLSGARMSIALATGCGALVSVVQTGNGP